MPFFMFPEILIDFSNPGVIKSTNALIQLQCNCNKMQGFLVSYIFYSFISFDSESFIRPFFHIEKGKFFMVLKEAFIENIARKISASRKVERISGWSGIFLTCFCLSIIIARNIRTKDLSLFSR